MTAKDDLRLFDRHPEFTRMSRRPGIGAGLLWDVASTLLEHDLEKRLVDVPVALRTNGRMMPLDQYSRRKLREMIGRERNAPQAVLDQIEAEMQTVYQAAEENGTSFKEEMRKRSEPQTRRYERLKRNLGRKKQL